MKKTRAGIVDMVKAGQLLEEAATLQTAFWSKLTELEAALHCDVDSTVDLDGMDVDELIKLGRQF